MCTSNRKVRFELPDSFEISPLLLSKNQKQRSLITTTTGKNKSNSNEPSSLYKPLPIIHLMSPLTSSNIQSSNNSDIKYQILNKRNSYENQNQIASNILPTVVTYSYQTKSFATNDKDTSYEDKKSSSSLPTTAPFFNFNEKNKKIKRFYIINNSLPKVSFYQHQQQTSATRKMESCVKIGDHFKRFRIFEDVLIRKRKALKLSEKADRKVYYLKPLRSSVPQASTIGMKRYLFCPDNHTNIVADLIQKWSRIRLREEDKLKSEEQKVVRRKDPLEVSVIPFRNLKASDIKNFSSFKMSLEREPVIPTLLRAACSMDNFLLNIVFHKIIKDGILPEVLNATDSSGRTALSYICSTNETQFLDILLKSPEIDVNLADNEGNTPLHFAAQAGQSEIIHMLLTTCKNLEIDAKNCWGFTPIMKAALQGKTKCARILLFAGASLVETDASRSLNASEWARFTGRIGCAEMLEKYARYNEKSKAYLSKVEVRKPPTNKNKVQHSNSLFSKLNRFISLKDSKKNKQNIDNISANHFNKKDLNNYLKKSASEIELSSNDGKNLQSNDNSVSVPKLIITKQTTDFHFKKPYPYETQREKMQKQQNTAVAVRRVKLVYKD